MSRLSLFQSNQAQQTVEELYKDISRRINAAQPGLCPVDVAASFVHISHAQSCGKCVPCRIGLGQLERLLDTVLDGTATMDSLDLIERTANSIYKSADCSIGAEAARMVLTGLHGFREDYVEHIEHGRCKCLQNQPVPCSYQCPAQVDVPGYVSLIHAKRYAEAVELIRKDNPFPAACGLICEHPCEKHCRRTLVDDPINIRGLKRYAVEHEGEIPEPQMYPPTGKKVAVVGGGPSGLTAAWYLSRMGHSVTVYEQREHLGGMMRYGIPAYRLPREILDHEIDGLKKAGFETVTGVSVGKDINIDELRKNNDAVYIAIGAHIGQKVEIEGEDADGVLSAVEMLRSIGDGIHPDFTGLRCVVIGGGNVAMDVARSSIRLGAKDVIVAYRRRKEDMPALAEEVEGAIADGCEVMEMHAPLRIEKDEEGKVAAIWLQPQLVGMIQWGRPKPMPAKVPPVRIPCDRVLVAVGQEIDSEPFGKAGIPVAQKNRFNASLYTKVKGLDNVYAGGDCVTGPATVIKAIAAGKIAAANIDKHLGFNHEIRCDIELPTIDFDDHYPRGRVNMRERPAAERVKDFKLMECAMTEEEALQESGRCLHCDHFGYGSFRGGRTEKW